MRKSGKWAKHRDTSEDPLPRIFLFAEEVIDLTGVENLSKRIPKGIQHEFSGKECDRETRPRSERIWGGGVAESQLPNIGGDGLLTPTCLDNYLALQKNVSYGITGPYLESILS